MENRSVTELVGERAEALAYVLLTRGGLIRAERVDNGALDLLASLSNNPRRMFGVKVKGYATRRPNGTVPFRHAEEIAELPFPVLLMVVEMEVDRVLYTWFNLDPPRPEGLLKIGAIWAAFRPFPEGAPDEIVGAVNSWYTARAALSA